MNWSSLESADEVQPDLAATVSVRFLKSELNRRRRVWAALAAAGLVLGIGYHHIVPRQYVADSLVSLAHPATEDPTTAMATDSYLATTVPVAVAAARDVGQHLGFQQFSKEYVVLVLSPDLLQISAHATSPATAARVDNAVVAEFMKFRASQFEEQNDQIVAGLKSQEHDLQLRVSSLDDEVGSRNGGSQSDLANLVSERSQLETALESLQGQVATDNLGVEAVVQGSRVINDAVVEHQSTLKLHILNAATGLIAGGGLGVIFVLVLALTSEQLRRRDDITAALGLPVLVSTPRARRWRRRRRFGDPLEPAVNWLVSDVAKGEQGGQSGDGVTLLTPDDVPSAARLAVATARRLSEAGWVVTIVDQTGTGALSGRRRSRRVAGRGRPPFHIVRGEQPDRPPPVVGDARRFVLALAVVNPATLPDPSTWHGSVVVVVTAGKSSADKLRSTGRQLRRVGARVSGVLLLGADRADESVGLLDEISASSSEPRVSAGST